MAWHRKHRPRKISELHLSNVRESLLKMMDQGKFPQVMLFEGPKGTGKTSASRIIGNLLNDESNADLVDAVFFGKAGGKTKSFVEPKTDSKFADQIYAGNSYVVQEMDAASHRGIDDVRALKERVMLPPQQGKMAVYILDEAHMLTTEAFNALLKLLEEPPPHAVFILATTELHKIPETIISRSTKLDFRKATEDEVKQALESVLKKEKIKFDEEALVLIAKRADGSFRDAVKSAELAVENGKLSVKSVEAALGVSVDGRLGELINAVLSKDDEAVVKLIGSFREQNLAEGFFYKSLFNFLHEALLQGLGVEEGEPVVNQKIAKFLLEELLKADLEQYTPIPFLPLELKLLSLIQRAKDKNGSQKTLKPASLAKKKINEELIKPIKIDSVTSSSPVIKEAVVESLPVIEKNQIIPDNIEELGKALLEKWEDLMTMIHNKNASLAALLRSGEPLINPDGLPELGVFYKFHLEQLEQMKNIKIVQDCTMNIFGNIIPLRIVLKETPVVAKLVEPGKEDEVVGEGKSQQLTKLAEEALM